MMLVNWEEMHDVKLTPYMLLLHVVNSLRHKPTLRDVDADDGSMSQQQAADVQRLHPQRYVFRNLDDVAQERKEVGLGDEHGGVVSAAWPRAKSLDVRENLSAQ